MVIFCNQMIFVDDKKNKTLDRITDPSFVVKIDDDVRINNIDYFISEIKISFDVTEKVKSTYIFLCEYDTENSIEIK